MAGDEQPTQAGMVSLQQVARLLTITDRRVQQLAKDGYIPKPSRGLYSLVGAVQGYIRFLRDEHRKGSEAESGLKATRQAEIEMRMAERRRELIALSAAEDAMLSLVGFINEEFSGFAARTTRDRALRDQIETNLDATLNRVSDRCGRARQALAGSGGPAAPQPADDAG